MTLKAYFGKNGLFSEVKKFSDFKVASSMAISDFFSSTTAKVVGFTAALTAMYAAFKWADNKYNLTYDTAKNTQGHLDNIESMTGEINQLESQSQTAKDTLSSLAGKYNIEITGTKTISELIDKLQEADLSLDAQIQADNIDAKNDKLESQLAIKQKILEYEQKEAADDAEDTLKRGQQSVAQKLAQTLPGGKKTYQQQVDNVNVVDAVKEDARDIEKYEEEIAKLEKQQKGMDVGSKKWKEAQKDIEDYNDAIKELTSDMSSKESDLQDLLKAFSADGSGDSALKSKEKQFNNVKERL